VIEANVRRLHMGLRKSELERITGLHANSLLNEFFRRGPREAARFVTYLKRWFPGKPAVFVDYYGRLGTTKRDPAGYAHTLLHDLVQALTGQGVPPPDWKGWRKVYEHAGAKVLHRLEGERDGVAWFAHVVRL
jgi:hypothetical protein